MATRTPEAQVASAMRAHPMARALIRAGRRRDQLLRSLIPLYIARQLVLDLDAGEIARVWRAFDVNYAVPNAAKALREHLGYARRTRTGRRISSAGVKYVERAV
jgi:hypothetical protein